MAKNSPDYFEYASFISYRHDDDDGAYIDKIISKLKPEMFKATDRKVFYDYGSIKWGEQWDDKIYYGIERSVFFFPIWYYYYLSEDNLWCAKELYHALEVEKIIKEQLEPEDRDKFYFIFPLIYRGDASLFPQSLSPKMAKSLLTYEYEIRYSKKESEKLFNFKRGLHDTLLEQRLAINEIIQKYIHIDFLNLFKTIKKPTDDEIRHWVKEQKKKIKEKEAEREPRLKKNEE
jgi:hypothetical protein